MNIFSKKAGKKETDAAPVQETAAPAPQAQGRIQARDYRLLNPTMLQRTRETLRLAETKLQNIEDNLKRLQQQREWLRRHCELKMQLTQEKTRLQELNKSMASMAEDAKMLERYETFESVESTFLRMSILEKMRRDNTDRRGEMEHEEKALQKKYDEQEKVETKATEDHQMAFDHFIATHPNLFNVIRTEGAIQMTELETSYLSARLGEAKAVLDATDTSLAEQKKEVELQEQMLERHRAGRQSIEMHEQMLTHGESVLLKLEYLQKTESRLNELRTKLKNAYSQQDEENEQMQRVFNLYQDILSQITSLEDELATHRANIHGLDGYKLQEQAMKLKSRMQMLLSAQSLWNRISMGYSIIEEKQGKLTELRLHTDHLEKDISDLEQEEGKTVRLCREKEYTYLLSKGQDVIQLRADLKEGVNCPVCGASHHPYHSDTMLEQSKLIGEFKTEYEQLEQDARGKRQTLDDLKQDFAECKGRMKALEETLRTLRTRQNEDVKEWRMFAPLDRQLEDCSPSTNAEARTLALGQLIENTTRDAEKTEKELLAFNYHQTLIAQLSERLQQMEQKKNELSTRLNELNTGCQVMAGQTDRIQTMIETENAIYRQTYDELDKIITIKDWLKKWQDNHENLHNQIQQIMTVWNTVNERIDKETHEIALEKLRLEHLQEKRSLHLAEYDSIAKHLEETTHLTDKKRKEHEQFLNGQTPEQYYTDNLQIVRAASEMEEKERERTKALLADKSELHGRNEDYTQTGEAIAATLAAEREKLDLWIHSYSAHNPPVRYQELENVFSSGMDWNAIRRKIRDTKQEQALCQANVDSLNSRFIALQAESGFHHIDEEEAQVSIATQEEALLKKRRDVMMQIARTTVAIEDHEKALHAMMEDEGPTEEQEV